MTWLRNLRELRDLWRQSRAEMAADRARHRERMAQIRAIEAIADPAERSTAALELARELWRPR